jgi:hypothetical protein
MLIRGTPWNICSILIAVQHTKPNASMRFVIRELSILEVQDLPDLLGKQPGLF